MFSELTHHFSHPSNPLYALKNRLSQEGQLITDLTSGNVTQHGLQFPQDLLRAALVEGVAQSNVYAPNPFGLLRARESISRWYAAQNVTLFPEQLLLTPGTSLSYLYAFQLLTNPGDEVLCPSPNYPLFDSIALMAGIRLSHYPLDEKNGWRIDLKKLKDAITEKTRAMVIISPHNPTGMVATAQELEAIAELARYHQLPIIVDEVFASFIFQGAAYPRLKSDAAPLILTLNGFSKMLALAGLKIGWMGVTGEPNRVATALKGLETISDTFLPVADAAQWAIPDLLEKSADFQQSYSSEIKRRAHIMREALQGIPDLTSNYPEGGFYTTVQLPDSIDEEKIALRLLEQEHVLIHPGYFYDVLGNHLVMSHVSSEEEIRESCGKLQKAIAALSR
jgi:alanine-synthesizing transaminase